MTFDERRRLKSEAGREERGRPSDEPFQGDPRHEYEMEQLDSPNYLDEMLRQGWVWKWERDAHYAIHRFLWLWIKRVQKREHDWKDREA